MNKICLKCKKGLQERIHLYGLHHECFKLLFSLDQIENFLDVAAKTAAQDTHYNNRINSSFFHGKFRKYSSRLGGVNYIMKAKQKEYPELPITEFVCNQIFRTLKIKIPLFYLVRFPEDDLCFVTENFMSNFEGSTLIHIYHFVKNEQKYNCEELVELIGKKTGRRTEQERFVYLTLADCLIGNNDRHGRNLGFIQNTKGIILSPFYDNPSALGVEKKTFLGADLQPKGFIYTRDSEEPTMKDYIAEWQRLGYENVVNDFRRNLAIENITSIILESLISDKRKQAMVRIVISRSEQLC